MLHYFNFIYFVFVVLFTFTHFLVTHSFNHSVSFTPEVSQLSTISPFFTFKTQTYSFHFLQCLLVSFSLDRGCDLSLLLLSSETSVAFCFDAWVAFSNSPELDASARAPHTKYRGVIGGSWSA